MKLQSASAGSPRTWSSVKSRPRLWIDKAAATTELTGKTPHFPRHGALSEGKGGCAFLASRRPANLVSEPCPDRHPSRQHSCRCGVLYTSFRHAGTGDQTLFPSLYSETFCGTLLCLFQSFRGFETQAVGKLSRRGALDGQVHDSFNSGNIKQPTQDQAGPRFLRDRDREKETSNRRRTEHVRRLPELEHFPETGNPRTSRTNHTRVFDEPTTTCPPRWFPLFSVRERMYFDSLYMTGLSLVTRAAAKALQAHYHHRHFGRRSSH